jgi:hypothetical protein
LIVPVGPSPAPLRDIRPDAIGGADELFTHRIFREGIPPAHDSPDPIRQLLRELVDLQLIEP